MSGPFIGEIRMFAGNYAPRGWAFCNGQLLAISQHQTLFSILGTTYGGDGRTTFGLPDLRGRAPVHQGSGPGLEPVSLGQRAGANVASLSLSHLPPHNHQVACSSEDAEETDAENNFPAVAREDTYAGSSDTQMNGSMIGYTGSGQPLSIMQPYLSVSIIIALEGVYPSRG